jgi:hypothetical protein
LPAIWKACICTRPHSQMGEAAAKDLGVVLAELRRDCAHPHPLADLDRGADIRHLAQFWVVRVIGTRNFIASKASRWSVSIDWKRPKLVGYLRPAARFLLFSSGTGADIGSSFRVRQSSTVMCQGIGHPGWCQDPRFATNRQRVANRAALEDMMNAVLTTKTTNHWVDVLEAVGVPCGPVYDYAQMFVDPQVHHAALCNTRDSTGRAATNLCSE